MLNKGVFFGMMFVLLGMLACRNTRHVVKVFENPNYNVDTAKYHLLSIIENKQLKMNTVSIKSKLFFGGNDVNASFRIKSGEFIWLSVGAMGIEGIRAMVTRDSVKVINNLSDTYVVDSMEGISKKYGINVKYEEIESILLGKCPSMLTDSSVVLEQDSANVYLSTVKNNIKVRAKLNKSYQMELLTVVDSAQVSQARIVYNSYAQIQEFVVPKEISIQFESKGKTNQVSLQYNKVVFNKELETPFKIPRKIRKKM